MLTQVAVVLYESSGKAVSEDPLRYWTERSKLCCLPGLTGKNV